MTPPKIMITIVQDGQVRRDIAIPYHRSAGILPNGNPTAPGSDDVQRYLNLRSGRVIGRPDNQQLRYFRSDAPDIVITWADMWARMKVQRRLDPPEGDKHHPDHYGRNDNFMYTSEAVASVLHDRIKAARAAVPPTEP